MAINKANDFIIEVMGGQDESFNPEFLGYRLNNYDKTVICVVTLGAAKEVDMPADIVICIPYKDIQDKEKPNLTEI